MMPSSPVSGTAGGLSTKEDLLELDRKLTSKEIDTTAAIKLLITAIMTVLPSATTHPPVEVKTLVKAQYEEVERGRCLVISGIPEYSSLTASECRKKITSFITSILDDLNMSCSVDKFFRMGTFTEGKSRLMKLVLPSSATQRAVLRALKSRLDQLKNKNIDTLWSHADAARVFIRPSLTLDDRIRGFALRLKRIRLASTMKMDKTLFSINYGKGIVFHSITKEAHPLSEEDITNAKRIYHQRRRSSHSDHSNSDHSNMSELHATPSSSTETVIAVPSSVNTAPRGRLSAKKHNSSSSTSPLNH